MENELEIEFHAVRVVAPNRVVAMGHRVVVGPDEVTVGLDGQLHETARIAVGSQEHLDVVVRAVGAEPRMGDPVTFERSQVRSGEGHAAQPWPDVEDRNHIEGSQYRRVRADLLAQLRAFRRTDLRCGPRGLAETAAPDAGR